jgi:pimeloyl-ACP methyl ester carboxylesterase
VHVDIVGSGPRLVLVHGSGGGTGWPAQRPLADRYTLVIPTRSGYPPNPPLARIDFDRQAGELLELLEAGDHLVGHSYGGVVSLLAAPRAPQLRSLTVVEPPAFRLARGDAAVDELVSRLAQLWSTELPPDAFLRRFVDAVGSASDGPGLLPPEVEASVRAMMAERPPWEAEIPLEDLRATLFPKLVVSGGHHAAFDAVCDVLEGELEAERAVVTGAGHSIPRIGEPFNEVLERFVAAAEGPEDAGREAK